MIGRLLDASIVFSFDRNGFRRHARGFRPEDLDANLSGRICLVTGANAGIGRATALALARRGATVWLLCRSEARGREAEAGLRAESGNPRIRLAVLDVSDLGSVRRFAEHFSEARVDLLVHNAGALLAERELTEEGIERTLATHVVGPFLLTRLLEGKLRAARHARIVFVSSGGMYTQRLSLDDLTWRRRAFDGTVAYAQAKRMQVVLTGLLAERLREDGVVVHAMHPGWAATAGVRTSLPRFWRATRAILRTAEEGADTAIWLAVAAEPARSSGGFWFDRAPAREHLLPFTRETADDRRALWDLCTRLAGLESAPRRRAPRRGVGAAPAPPA